MLFNEKHQNGRKSLDIGFCILGIMAFKSMYKDTNMHFENKF